MGGARDACTQRAGAVREEKRGLSPGGPRAGLEQSSDFLGRTQDATLAQGRYAGDANLKSRAALFHLALQGGRP